MRFATLLLVTVLLATELPAAQRAPITCLTWTPDGRTILAGSQFGITLYDAASRQIIEVLDVGLDNIHDVAFAPTGHRLLASGGRPGEEGLVVELAWPSREVMARYAHHSDLVYDVAWSSDGKVWASAGADGLALLWNAETGKVLGELRGHSGPVSGVAFLSPKTLVTASADHSLRVWLASDRTLIRTLSQHTATVHALAMPPSSPDARLPLAATVAADRTVRFWQPTIGRMVRFARLDTIPLCAAWTHDAQHVVVGCDDGTVRVIDSRSVTVVHQQPVLDGWVYAVAVGREGAILAGGQDGKLYEIAWRPTADENARQ